MSPSYSTKRGVRYRFYVNTAVLTGRSHETGSVARISAPDLEASVMAALRGRFPDLAPSIAEQELVDCKVERVELAKATIRINLKSVRAAENPLIEIACAQLNKGPRARIEGNTGNAPSAASVELIQAVAKAHMWIQALIEARFRSIEELAASVNLHPKVIRKRLRLAFLAPDITAAILSGHHQQSLTLAKLYETGPLCWAEQRHALNFQVAA